MPLHVRVNSGNFAGRIMLMEDDQAATAIADGWAEDATEYEPFQEWAPAPEEVPQSLLDFEADPLGDKAAAEQPPPGDGGEGGASPRAE